MKAPDFYYCRPQSIADACDILADSTRDARVLAGGQSMMPMLNLRLAVPDLLVDINRIAPLKGIVEAANCHVRIGALVRHAEVATSPIVAQKIPLIAMAMHHVAHPAVRNRGTTCGSLALADPSAEMPACAIALDATLVLQSKRTGLREVKASEFFFGLYSTARRDDELLVEVKIPCCKQGELFGFGELSRRHGDFAMVGVAATATVVEHTISNLRLVVFGTDPMPVLALCATAIAEGRNWSTALGTEIAANVAEELRPDTNLFGSPAVKRQQARALIKRVLTEMFSESKVTHE